MQSFDSATQTQVTQEGPELHAHDGPDEFVDVDPEGVILFASACSWRVGVAGQRVADVGEYGGDVLSGGVSECRPILCLAMVLHVLFIL